MEPSGQFSSGLDGELDGENCLKEIANNYVEDEDIDNSSGDEIGVARENGIPFSQDTEGRHVLAKNGTEDYRGNDSASEGVGNEVSDDGSGGEDSGEESSGKDEEQDGDDEDDEGEEEAVKEGEVPEGNYGTAALGRGEADNVFVNKSSREHGKLVGNERYSAAGQGLSIENEEVDNAHGIENGLQVPEKSQTESESGPHIEGAQGGPALRRRRGRPLKSSDRKLNVRAAPITPKLEEPRVVRVNRGVKRRFPGDESEDSLPKRIRVRSIASVCGDFSQQVKGEDLSMDESHEITPARKRGRPRKSDGGHSVGKADEAETLSLPSTGKRKMVEAVLDSDNLKRSCNTRNGPIYACNAEGCKKRFEEAADLYVHARVHGDRPYVCHYEGCVKSFSERSKLKRHFLIHTGEKPFLCMYEGCGKAFSLDFNLRSHMKTHTGDYHECPYDGCDKRYCQEYKLRAHVAKEHSKPVRGAKKATKAVGKNVRGANGSKAGDLAAAKKRDTLSALYQKRLKLEQIKEDRVARIAELEDERRREASELARVEQELKKIERELRQLEGHAGSSALSLSEEEDEAEDEEEEEEEEEEGGDPSPSNGTAGDTSSSGEQQSRLEYTAMGDGKDVVMFAHKLPTADQGARLVKTMGGRHADWSVKTMGGRPAELQQEQTTSITPHLWLQGHPPHHGHLAQHLGARPALRSRRPTVPPVMVKPSSSSGEKDRTVQQKRINGEMWSQGESSDSGMERPNGGAQKLSEGSAEGKSRASTFKKNLVAAGRGPPKPNTSRESPIVSIEGENGKVDQKPQKRITAVDQAKAPKQQIGRPPSSEPPVFVSMNPILLSTDHRFSPTDARFLATEGIMAQGSLRDRLQVKEVVKSFAGQSCVPKEKSYRSMNEVLHSSHPACLACEPALLQVDARSERRLLRPWLLIFLHRFLGSRFGLRSFDLGVGRAGRQAGTMSVVGLDVGNENCIVGVARQRGIDVVLNDESKRETPAMVSFGEKQRFVGVAGAASAMMNPRNTISQIKRLIGRPFADPELQRDLRLFPFAVTEGPDGFPLINVQYLGEQRQFTPTQILGMLLSNLKSIAEKNLGTSVVDCVIGVPVYFTELQRRAYLDAAQVAGLHPLRLMHETTATALAYGIYKTDLSDTEPLNVAFVDIGHASMQVCIAAFKKGQLKILGHSFDRCLGGRDFDEVLFDHFAAKFKEEYKMDVPANPRASLRLRAGCEKAKKILSANPIAPLNIECLMDEKDVKGVIKRDEFEELSKGILERVRGPCEQALASSKLSVDQIFAVEVVGSGSRVPAILKILSSVFGKEPSRTMNASECIARGCTLQCAMLSPTFRVRDFEVQDSFPFPIGLSWKGAAPETEGEEEVSSNNVVFVKGNPVPSTKLLTFYRSSTFAIDAFYADTADLPPNMAAKIATFTIGPFTPTVSEKAKIKVKIRLNLHGVVSLEAATMIEEEEVEVPVTKKEPAAAAAADEKSASAPAESNAADVGAENGTGEEGAKMETDAPKPEVVKKKKTKRTDVPVHEVIYGGLPAAELTKAVEKEFEMALQDRVMEETKESKNAVEAYVYGMRNKLYEKLQDYVTDHEREEMSARLQETEDWLYEDGEDEIKSVYTAKLAELKKYGDPMEARQREEELRGPAMRELSYCISSFREAAQSKDPKFDHIDAGEKEKVISECNKAEEWFKEKKQQQDGLPKSANPVLLAADLKKKTEVLDRFCKPIMTKPRPAPPKPAPAAEPKPAPAGSAPDAAAAPEPMDTDAPAASAAAEPETMQTDQ